MHLDPLLPLLAAVSVGVLLIGFVLRKLGQPYVVGYLVAGIVLGPHGLRLITDHEATTQLGAIGVVLLLFFVGMEISPERLLSVWRIALGGTALQILVSVGCVWGLGAVLGWSAGRIVLLGFVISLSSTAVVLKLVKERPDVDERLATQVTGVLLVQDIALVPMLLILGFLRGDPPDAGELAIQFGGAVVVVAIFVWIVRRRSVRLGIGWLLAKDRELQVFAGLIACFGLSCLTGLAGLSTALGAFLAGMLITAGQETHWIHHVLEPFRVVFVAVFFLSVGILLDIDFLVQHRIQIAVLALLVFLTNTFINAGILRLFRTPWRQSLCGGALLSQIGELSYLVAAVGLQAGIVTEFAHQTTVAVITITLIASPAWVQLMSVLTRVRTRQA